MANTKKDNGADMGKVVLGTAIGVGIGAAAVALSNKETRKKLSTKTNELKTQAEKSLKKGSDDVKDMQKTVKANMDEMMKGQADAKKTIEKRAKAPSKHSPAMKTA